MTSDFEMTMNRQDQFLLAKPSHPQLKDLIEYYFLLDTGNDAIQFHQETIIPFPRITFGYFFDQPFRVTRLKTGEIRQLNFGVSRLMTDQVQVEPLFQNIKIVGVHARPQLLACLTSKPVGELPWLIDLEELFPATAPDLRLQLGTSESTNQMFRYWEEFFLKNLIQKDQNLVEKAIQLIDQSKGKITVAEVTSELKVNERSLRNHFSRHLGCSPKAYAQLVRIKQVVFQLKNDPVLLTRLAHEQEYHDQAHFIHAVKELTGMTPSNLKKLLPSFRFLQF